LLTLAMLIVQGLFFAGSPTAGEGMTAQRFMAARSEKQAMAGQLFNSFLSLSLRTIPLIGLGIIAFSLFWTKDLLAQVGPAPAGMPVLADPAYAWGTLIKMTRLPPGFTGVLIASELAAFMSGLSSMINWGSSLLVNDFYRSLRPNDPPRVQITVSRLTTLGLFVFAALVSILWVKGMVSWFLFINSVMVVFLLPLSWLRFFWWRFNVWGELSALVLGLPLSVLFWFILDFQNKPFWQSTGLLFVLSLVVLIGVTLLTPPESKETLVAFYRRCRPPGRWAGIREAAAVPDIGEPSTGRLAADGAIGILASLGLVLATNAAFVGDWLRFGLGLGLAAVFSIWLMRRVLA
jgi:Na+/proline symporter